MTLALIQLTGTIDLPTGETPSHGRIRFEFSQWGKNGANIFVPGPVEFVLSAAGELVDCYLQSTAALGGYVLCHPTVIYWSAQANREVQVALSVIDVPLVGPVPLADLLANPAPMPSGPDALAQALAAAADARSAAGGAHADSAAASAVASAGSAATSSAAATVAQLAAIAAGAPIVTALPGTIPANGTVNLLHVDVGLMVYQVVGGAWVLQGWLQGPDFTTVAQLGASSAASLGAVGGVVRAGGYRYLIAAPAATDHHLTTVGGVKLYVTELGGRITLTQFNASGIGFADAFAKVQAMLNASVALGVVAYIPAGDYGISDKLVAPSGLRLKLDGNAELRRIGTAGGLMDNFAAGATVPGRTANGDIKITGGVWHGNGLALGSNSIFNVAQCVGFSIEDALITDCRGGHHIELCGAKDVTVRNCRCTVYSDPGGRDFSEAIQIDYCGSSGQLAGLNAASYDGTPCENVLLENLTFIGCARAIGSHTWLGTDAHFSSKITVRNIVTIGCTSDTIRPMGWRDFTIDGLDSDASGSTNMVVRIEDCDRFKVRNIKGRAAGGRGVWIYRNLNPVCTDWLVENVNLDGVGGGVAAIEALNVGRGIIRRAKITNTTGYGINVSTCTDVDVEGCDVSGTTQQTLRLYQNNNVEARGNRLVMGGSTRVIDIQLGSNQRAVANEISGVVAAKDGITISNSAARALARGNRISGTAGNGINVSGTVTAAWLDNNDLRDHAGTKINNAGTGTVQTSNQE